MKRVEDPRLLTGKGKYIDDIVLPNMAHAAVLGSPHAHARVKSIDVSKELRNCQRALFLHLRRKTQRNKLREVASFLKSAGAPILHGNRQDPTRW